MMHYMFRKPFLGGLSEEVADLTGEGAYMKVEIVLSIRGNLS